jgi:hypothetical protein
MKKQKVNFEIGKTYKDFFNNVVRLTALIDNPKLKPLEAVIVEPAQRYAKTVDKQFYHLNQLTEA